MTDAITIRRIVDADALAVCLSIRRRVFIEGQNVDEALEVDGCDDACRHYLAYCAGQAVATARVMVLPDRLKYQRVAVLAPWRGRGIGAAMMRFIMNDLENSDHGGGNRRHVLSSQVDAIAFYERLGFEVCSDIYLDAGIEHRDMQRVTA